MACAKLTCLLVAILAILQLSTAYFGGGIGGPYGGFGGGYGGIGVIGFGRRFGYGYNGYYPPRGPFFGPPPPPYPYYG